MKFTELLDEYHIRYQTEGHHSRPGWIQIDCPYCGRGSNKFHMGYNVDKNYTNCWKCGPHRLFDALADLTGESWQTLKEKLNVEFSIRSREERKTGRLQLPKGLGDL